MIRLLKKLTAKILGPKYVYRSSITGEYVTEAYASIFPDQTVRERVR